MIIAIVGNVGSGKSIKTVKEIVGSKKICMVNFDVRAENVLRLKKSHIVKEEIPQGKKKAELSVNWDFWNESLKKYGEYHLVLDEAHNLFSSRRSMSTWNVLSNQWLSQIRKLIGDKERTNIYIVTQRPSKIDRDFRDLLHQIHYCFKYETDKLIPTWVLDENGKRVKQMLPETYILTYRFSGENCLDKYYAFKQNLQKTYDKNGRSYFLANPYFQFYNSYQVFGETAYL